MPSGIYKRTEKHHEIIRNGMTNYYINGGIPHNKGKTKETYEPSRRTSEKQKGELNSSKRIEVRQKIKKTMIKLWENKAFQEKMRNSHIGYKQTKEHIENRTSKLRGQIRHFKDPAKRNRLISIANKGIERSDVFKANASQVRKKYLRQNPTKIGKSRGKSGYFYSNKNQKKMPYRSSWELIAMKIFEQMSNIVKYEYEVLSISYYDKKGTLHYTIPDFVVYYNDGTKEIIEVKPKYKIEKNLDNTNIKLDAMQRYAKENNMSFSLLTEKELFNN